MPNIVTLQRTLHPTRIQDVQHATRQRMATAGELLRRLSAGEAAAACRDVAQAMATGSPVNTGDSPQATLFRRILQHICREFNIAAWKLHALCNDLRRVSDTALHRFGLLLTLRFDQNKANRARTARELMADASIKALKSRFDDVFNSAA